MIQAIETIMRLQWQVYPDRSRRTISFISGMAMMLLLWSSCVSNSVRNYKTLKGRCSDEERTEEGEWRKIKSVSYDSLIYHLKESINLSPTPQALFSCDSFIHVFENPYIYMEVAKKMIADSSITKKEQDIIIYSMQKMGLKKYLHWNNYLHQLYHKKMISFDQLEKSITGWTLVEFHILEQSYNDKDVRAFYKMLINDTSISEKKKQYYKNVLSGKMWKKLGDYMADIYPCIYLVGDSLAKAKQ